MTRPALRRLHRDLTLVLSACLVLLGILIGARTAQLGGGSVGFLLAALFVAAGAGRLYLALRR
jgi:hypothetical protein